MSDVVRVLRILEYVGDRAWVEKTLQKGNVPAEGVYDVCNGNMIKSCLADKFPEIIGKEK